MERLWAPWRMEYIAAGSPEARNDAAESTAGCVFCDAPRAESDAANLIIARGETCFVILNAFPYNNGHVMVVPFRHLARPADLTGEENSEIMRTASALTALLDGIYRPAGYNIGMNVGSAAGAGIAGHLHLHVVPRWSGDTNFMSVVGDIKVLPEMLDRTYTRLRDALANAL